MSIDWISCIIKLVVITTIWILLFIFENLFQFYIKSITFFTFSSIYTILFILVVMFRLKNSRNIYYFSQTVKYIYKIFSINYIIENEENLKIDGPFIMIANHQSAFDWMPMMKIWPNRKCSLIAKKEIFYMWPIGLGLWLCDTTFIDRSNKMRAKSTIAKLSERITNENLSIFIFPEGTRSLKRMLPFKKGAFHLAIKAQVNYYNIFRKEYIYIS